MGQQSDDCKSRKKGVPPTRKSLLVRLKDWKDQDSWQEFFKIYEKLIFETAKRSGLSDVEAQEVVQETLLSVAKKIAGFNYDPDVGSFKGWLLQITRRRIVDQLRKRKGGREVPQSATGALLDHVSDPADSELEELWNREWNQVVLEMARALVKRQVSPRQYEMFDLYAIQHKPMAEVTKTLGVNRAQVYMAKYRITQMLRKEIKQLEEDTL